MSVPSKFHNILLVKIQPEERLAPDVNKIGLITYPESEEVVLLKSRMRENLKPYSVRAIIAAPRQNNPKRRWL